MSIRKLMSSLRRSARLAAKAGSKSSVSKSSVSKSSVPEEMPKLVTTSDLMSSVPEELPELAPSTVVEQPNNFFLLTGAGSSGKSLFHKALSSNKSWSLDYTLYPAETNMKDKSILDAAIVHHETQHSRDTWKALTTYHTVWEHEMDVAARWLCIDRRILKNSGEMRVRAKINADKINDYLPALYAKIDGLKKQLFTLEGYIAESIQHELLQANLLLTVAEHAHHKWNAAMIEYDKEQSFLRANLNTLYKPEMPNDSDDDW